MAARVGKILNQPHLPTPEYMDNEDNDEGRAKPRPWIALTTTYDVEAWIDHYNRELKRAMETRSCDGYGICFILAEGGEIFMHTTAEGDVLLDVTPDAEWVTPVIAAATQVNGPLNSHSQIWTLPGDTLTQLILGLGSLISQTRLVYQHTFQPKKFKS
jgi:hypothetical protein